MAQQADYREYEETIPRESIPHQSLEGEQAALGAILTEQSVIDKVAERIAPTDFYREAHRVIFEAMLALRARKEPIDLLTLREQLVLMGALENVGGHTYLIQLMNAVPSAAAAESYAKIVYEKAWLRSLTDFSNQVRALAYSEYDDIEDVRASVETAAASVLALRGGGEWRRIGEGVEAVFEMVMDRKASGGKLVTGLGTPWDDLDYLTRGWQAGDLIVVAGRPSMGKSVLMHNQALYTAKRHGSVAVVTLEMPAAMFALRLLSAEARIDMNTLKSGEMTDGQWDRFTEACDVVSRLPIYVEDSASTTISDVKARCRKLAKTDPSLALVAVDYIQLLHSGQSGKNRAQEVGDMAKDLQRLARETNVPVMVVSQINRGVEQRADKRPMLSDLAESSGLEAAADTVVFLYRDSYYQRKDATHADDARAADEYRDRRGEEDVDVAEVNIAKQRNGETGRTELAFIGSQSRFDNLAKNP